MPDVDIEPAVDECAHPANDPRWTCSACITHLATDLERSDR